MFGSNSFGSSSLGGLRQDVYKKSFTALCVNNFNTNGNFLLKKFFSSNIIVTTDFDSGHLFINKKFTSSGTITFRTSVVPFYIRTNFYSNINSNIITNANIFGLKKKVTLSISNTVNSYSNVFLIRAKNSSNIGVNFSSSSNVFGIKAKFNSNINITFSLGQYLLFRLIRLISFVITFRVSTNANRYEKTCRFTASSVNRFSENSILTVLDYDRFTANITNRTRTSISTLSLAKRFVSSIENNFDSSARLLIVKPLVANINNTVSSDADLTLIKKFYVNCNSVLLTTNEKFILTKRFNSAFENIFTNSGVLKNRKFFVSALGNSFGTTGRVLIYKEYISSIQNSFSLVGNLFVVRNLECNFGCTFENSGIIKIRKLFTAGIYNAVFVDSFDMNRRVKFSAGSYSLTNTSNIEFILVKRFLTSIDIEVESSIVIMERSCHFTSSANFIISTSDSDPPIVRSLNTSTINTSFNARPYILPIKRKYYAAIDSSIYTNTLNVGLRKRFTSEVNFRFNISDLYLYKTLKLTSEISLLTEITSDHFYRVIRLPNLISSVFNTEGLLRIRKGFYSSINSTFLSSNENAFELKKKFSASKEATFLTTAILKIVKPNTALINASLRVYNSNILTVTKRFETNINTFTITYGDIIYNTRRFKTSFESSFNTIAELLVLKRFLANISNTFNGVVDLLVIHRFNSIIESEFFNSSVPFNRIVRFDCSIDNNTASSASLKILYGAEILELESIVSLEPVLSSEVFLKLKLKSDVEYITTEAELESKILLELNLKSTISYEVEILSLIKDLPGS